MTGDKTLAMKLLEGRKIPYEVVVYPETEREARVIAVILGIPPRQMFKSLIVARPPAKPILAAIPGPSHLDLKRLAKVMGEKKLKMAAHAEAEALTGLQVGGISPLALLNKGFVMLIDEAVREFDAIYISAGQKGVNLKVPVAPLLKLTKMRVVGIAGDED